MSPLDPPGPAPDETPPPRPVLASAPLKSNDTHGANPDTLLLHISATVWMTDERMVLTFVSGELIRRLQVDPATLVGRTLPDLLLDGREDHPIIQGHVTALAGHETGVRIEWGGNLYNARIAPVRDGSGRIVGCVGVQQMIGWLPDDDRMLRESDIRLRRVIDENPVGIAFGDDEGLITDTNDAFLHLSGYTREDLVAESVSWPALMPVEHHPRQIQALNEILTTGRCAPFESEIIRKDGRHVAVVLSAARLSARRREGVAFVLDISERKLIEKRLRTELACADALAGAASLDDVGEELLHLVCTNLEWDEAVLWITAVDGVLQLVARRGAAVGHDRHLEQLAERAVTGGKTLWSDASPPPALAAPFMAGGRCYGVLVLVSGAPEGPCAGCAASSLSIAERIGKFVARHA